MAPRHIRSQGDTVSMGGGDHVSLVSGELNILPPITQKLKIKLFNHTVVSNL